ncbi:MAG: 4Fe-4S binding protein [Elusimicrobia bacterium]|nr:4Fe-4S binding protein [Candidatus Liberimonas magnetica]
MNTNTKRLIYLRFLSQASFFLFIVYILWAMKRSASVFTNPVILFQFDPFAMYITALAEKVFLAGLAYSLITLVLTLIFGRFFCGWLCPLGSLLDLWAFILSFFKKMNKEKEPGGTRNSKFVILAVIVVFALFGVQAAWTLDPLTIFVRSFSFAIHPFLDISIDKIFIFLLKATNYMPSLENLYDSTKGALLEIKNPAFPHTWLILLELALILILVFFKKRFWCRYLCPLGATLAFISKFSFLKRKVFSCEGECPVCSNICRMNAIKKDNSYIKEECILCMDCISLCPGQKARFTFEKDTLLPKLGVIPAKAGIQKIKLLSSWIPAFAGMTKNVISNLKKAFHWTILSNLDTYNRNKTIDLAQDKGLTRAQFLLFSSSVFFSLAGLKKTIFGFEKTSKKRPVIRPPGAIEEKEFLQRCIRCGNCMKVCITNVLQPCVLESGLSGIWTPNLMMELACCEYNCKLCTQVCPTGAIEKITLDHKKKLKIGKAKIDKNICVAWAGVSECIVCEEQCPIPDKAIKLEKKTLANGKIIGAPVVDETLCIGCGSCQYMCPTRPKRAIKVEPL